MATNFQGLCYLLREGSICSYYLDQGTPGPTVQLFKELPLKILVNDSGSSVFVFYMWGCQRWDDKLKSHHDVYCFNEDGKCKNYFYMIIFLHFTFDIINLT